MAHIVRPHLDYWNACITGCNKFARNCVYFVYLVFFYQLSRFEENRKQKTENRKCYGVCMSCGYIVLRGKYESVKPPFFGDECLWVAIISTKGLFGCHWCVCVWRKFEHSFLACSSPAWNTFISIAKTVRVQHNNTFVFYLEVRLETLQKDLKLWKKCFCKSSFQVGMDLKKYRNKAWDETTQ